MSKSAACGRSVGYLVIDRAYTITAGDEIGRGVNVYSVWSPPYPTGTSPHTLTGGGQAEGIDLDGMYTGQTGGILNLG